VEAEAAVTRTRGVGLLGLATAAAVVLIAIGVRSIGIAESSRFVAPVAAIPFFVVGVWLPLLGLIYAVSRRRVAVVALAFLVGLSTNLVFLTHAVPAAAVTDNSGVFTLENSSNYDPPRFDMEQHYTPTASTATLCPSAGNAYNWTCRFASDQFSGGDTLNSGTATGDLYLANDPAPPTTDYSNGYNYLQGAGNVSSVTIPQITGLVSGDVIIAHIALRGGTNNGPITPPSASWNLVDRMDSGTSVTLAVYSLVAGASEPASYTWSWTSGAVRAAALMRNFSGVDTSAPVDAHAGATESVASTSHSAPSVNAAYPNEMRVVGIAEPAGSLCGSITGLTGQYLSSTGSGGNGSQVGESYFYSWQVFLPAGPTGAATATCGNDIAATHQLTLKPLQTARTCTVTAKLKLLTRIERRSTSTAILNLGPSISINAPAGVVPGDVLVATVAKSGAEVLTTPAGWTKVDSVLDNSTMYLGLYWRVAASGDPASFSWTWAGGTSRYAAGGISAYANVDNDNPVDGHAPAGVSNTTSFPAPTITTTFINDMIVTAHAVNANNTNWTPPAGMNERLDLVAGSGSFVSIEQNDFLQAFAGATGAKTATSSVTGGGGGITLALKPGRTLGTGTVDVTSPTGAVLSTANFATTAVTFAAGDRLELDVVTPNDSTSCQVRLSYDSTSTPSKLTLATVVPEVAGLLLLAPALPFGARWWKRRR
jgi:hypothetical protein